MTTVILDASALLALIFEEPGSGRVAQTLEEGVAMSAVNASEVAARLHKDDWSPREVADVFDNLNIDVLPFDLEGALLSAQYRAGTESQGLGIGDRACLATGYLLKVPVLTADRVWLKLKIQGVTIESIR